MDALLGFESASGTTRPFAALFVIVVAGLALLYLSWACRGASPSLASILKQTPSYLMGWVGFFAVVPWIKALIWAFKPTDVVDLRYLPRDVKRETEEMLARLTGKAFDRTPRGVGAGVKPRHAVMIAAILVLIVAFTAALVGFLSSSSCFRLTPAWGIVSAFFVLHLLLVFLIGLQVRDAQFDQRHGRSTYHPACSSAAEPTLVSAVLVRDNLRLRRAIRYSSSIAAPTNTRSSRSRPSSPKPSKTSAFSKADVEVASQKAKRAKIELEYEQYQKGIFDKLAKQQAVREEDIVEVGDHGERRRRDPGRGTRRARTRPPQVRFSNRRGQHGGC